MFACGTRVGRFGKLFNGQTCEKREGAPRRANCRYLEWFHYKCEVQNKLKFC